jgi:hypothetical protein
MSAKRTELWGSVAFSAACATAAFISASIATGLAQPVLSASFACLVAAGAEAIRRAKVARLRREVDQSSTQRQLLVAVNGVQAGAITEREYAELLATMLDARTYAAQVTNVAAYVFNCLTLALVWLPIGIFWWIAIASFFEPQAVVANGVAIAHSLESLKSAGAVRQLVQQVGTLFVNVLSTTIVIAGAKLSFCIGRQPVNEFTRHLSRRVRKHIGCASEGDVVVYSSTAAGMVDTAGSAAWEQAALGYLPCSHSKPSQPRSYCWRPWCCLSSGSLNFSTPMASRTGT